jgi:PKD repeat protein
LTATDACGFTTHQELLTVTCEAPQTAFNWQGGELAYTFTNQTGGQLPIDYEWDFGDGLTSTEASPAHPYDVPGPYTVTLTAANICGVDSHTALLEAACSAPQAGFSWTASDLQAAFTNQSTGRFELSFEWHFGDGLTSTLASPVHDYALPGDYSAVLSATDLCGTGTLSDLLSLSCPVPEALFSYEISGLLVNLTNQSGGTTPLSYAWDFGDGFTSTEQSPSHQYTSPGYYTISLTVSEACGVDTFEITVWSGGFTFLPMLSKH